MSSSVLYKMSPLPLLAAEIREGRRGYVLPAPIFISFVSAQNDLLSHTMEIYFETFSLALFTYKISISSFVFTLILPLLHTFTPTTESSTATI